MSTTTDKTGITNSGNGNSVVKPAPGTSTSVLPIMDMVSGLWMSQTLVTAHERDIFGRYADAPGMTPLELAHVLDLQERPVEQLVTGCAALGLLERYGQ